MVVEEILGVVKLAPIETDAPSVETVYHMAVPVAQVAPNITVPIPQITAAVTVDATGIGLMVAITSVLPDSQSSVVLQLT